VKKITLIACSLAMLILFSSWGYRGHKKISESAPPCFPPSLSFLLGNFSTVLVDSASAPDYRKDRDPNEEPKHYLDIDNYNEFLMTGRIPMTWDSITLMHPMWFILDNGTLPWATEVTFDSLKSCFARHDLTNAAYFAADLGHYVGDGHQPLHITANFDGQLTGNDEIHSRYETYMINSFNTSIIYPVDSVEYIADLQSFIFTYIYENYRYVDSILNADNIAKSLSGGSTSSSVYKQALWDNTKSFTIPLFRHATFSLASMIYTAWVDSQNLGIPASGQPASGLGQNFPNPASDFTTIPFETATDNSYVSLKIYDDLGNEKAILFDGRTGRGHHQVRWETKNLPGGIYLCILQSDDGMSTRKLTLVH
jgi:hypothetical protein